MYEKFFEAKEQTTTDNLLHDTLTHISAYWIVFIQGVDYLDKQREE